MELGPFRICSRACSRAKQNGELVKGFEQGQEEEEATEGAKVL